MLIRLVVMVSVAAAGLALAACAETGSALATYAAEQAAQIAATEAVAATTQEIEQLQAATSRMSQQVKAGTFQLPFLPPVHKGTMVLVLPNAIIIQKNGHRYVFPRSQLDVESTGDVMPLDLRDPEQQ